jgi:hypothetical protein
VSRPAGLAYARSHQTREGVLTEDNDTRFELIGILVTVVVAAIGFAIFAGVLIGFWATIVVTLGFGLIAVVLLYVWSTRRSQARPPAADAPHVKPLDDGRYRVLVVADEGVISHFADELRTRAGGRPVSVFVMAPALESRFGLLTEDQKGYDEASQRLKEILEAFEGAGLTAKGEIGSSDPLQAADDGLRQFPANEIVFATHPEGKSNWLEEGLVAMAESRYDQPVRHVTVS